MVHRPKNKAKAVVVLIAGGILGTGITGDPLTGQVFTAGENFLVRSAQLFAEDGYIAVTILRPAKPTIPPAPEFPTTGTDAVQWDHYRISPKHAFDIVRDVAQVNADNLPVFLAGTSSGSISMVAQNMLGNGILISSPVTAGCSPSPPCGLFINI